MDRTADRSPDPVDRAGLALLLVGGVLTLLGQLLGIPEHIRYLGIFQHVPDIAAPHPDVRALLILLVCACGAGLLAGW